jgi:hypothetical protein
LFDASDAALLFVLLVLRQTAASMQMQMQGYDDSVQCVTAFTNAGGAQDAARLTCERQGKG